MTAIGRVANSGRKFLGLPVLFLSLLLTIGCRRKESVVILYTSQDQVYAEPILADFTRETGVQVRAVFDSEAAKTAGLANRLRAERRAPQCDVFWSNEEMHTAFLIEEGILDGARSVKAGYRSRQLVVNTNDLQTPASLLELTNAAWRGKIALAYPLFGTTASHFFALRQHWGQPLWEQWCDGLLANKCKVVEGNALVVRLVGTAEATMGLTDSDDVAAGLRQGLPIEGRLPVSEQLLIPNTISLVKGGPNKGAGDLLFAWLQRKETLEQLVMSKALEGAAFPESSPIGLRARWDPVEFARMTAFLKGKFLRNG